MRQRLLLTASAAALAVGAVAIPLATADDGSRAAPGQRAKSDDGLVVFTSDRDGDNEIVLRDPDGGLVQLTQNGDDDHGAVWSPDGSRLAFVSNRDGDPEIYVMNAQGGDVRQLTRNGGGDMPVIDGDVAWSPDGTRLAFTSNRDGGETEIYVMSADGSNQQRLTHTEPWVMNSGPDWSPDGSLIAFSSARESYENLEIYVMRPDGSQLRQLTHTEDGVDENAAAWSPDGKRIAFTSNRDATHDLFVMNADGSGVRKVTGDPMLDDVFPRWSPSGRSLLFWTFAGPDGTPTADVWSVRLNGKERRQLVATEAEESAPDVRPARR